MDVLQAMVLRAMLTKRGWAEYSDVLTMDVLTNTNVQAVYTHILALHGKTDGDLSPELVRMDIQSSYRQGDDRAEELCDLVTALARADKEVEPNALRDAVQRFVQRELIERVGRECATSLSSEIIDVASIEALIARAVDVGESVHTSVLDALTGALPGDADDRPGIIGMGISNELDRVLGGGVAAGELVVFVAPPARGKTSYLCAAGAGLAIQGRKVLHITLEIPAVRVSRRYDAAWSGLSRHEMIERPGIVADARRRVAAAGGAVLVKDWSYRSEGCSPSDIKGLVRRMRAEGTDIDVVIVDYLELMVPNASRGAGRQEMRHIFGRQIKETRAAGVSMQLPILSAWQINRAGSEVDTVSMAHVSECYDLTKHADIIIGLNQSVGEAENKQMRLGVLKQRDSTARPQVLVRSDLDRCRIRDLQEGNTYEDRTHDLTATP